ncbi:MAG: thioredoxin domain-containing protein [Gammaproteobacteria bacterium]|nr:thioredoxin domain-containing protein [Gammaproteobacteria bacterium]
MKKNQIIIAAVVIMGLFFSLAAYFYNAEQTQIQNQRAEKHARSLTPFHAVRKGDPQAKVTIVEFFDPACGTCKEFHPVINDLLKKYPKKINLVARYAPFHPGSDQMVAILEAARKQSQFWNVLDIMYESQEFWVINHQANAERFWGILEGYGVDINRIQQDMQDTKIAEIIQKDLADGELLGVSKTPTFFVNGKPLSSFGYAQLMSLVQSELEANY